MQMYNVRVFVLILLIIVSFFIYTQESTKRTFSSENILRVVFFDVGQGDSAFIETPDGKQILIDGGSDSSVLRKLSSEMGFFDREIDMIIATHPDSDHIGGLVDVFERYEVKHIVMTENNHQSPVVEQFLNRVVDETATVHYARRDMVFDFGGEIKLRILFPDRDPTNLESNTSSVVVQLIYRDSEFLFTGDSPKGIEEYLVSIDSQLESDVLKVGHHGSKTSTSQEFLEKVQAKYAVISAGKDNRYGHPHSVVIEALQEKRVEIFETSVMGDIIFSTDGAKIWVK